MVRSAQRLQARYLRVDLANIQLRLGGRMVLRGVDWRIEPGQHWLLVGGNGAGKTQLLKLIAGDVWPTPATDSRRRYRWRREIFDDPYGVSQEIAYVGAERQDRYEHYDWNHRVAAIVGTGLQRSDIPLEPVSAAQRLTVGRTLRRLGLAALVRRRYRSLSYGERRLVLLARAWASRPKLLLLDEFFNGLDARHHARALRFLESLKGSGLPWISAVHRAADIPASATHVCELVRGRIVRRGALTQRLRRRLERELTGVADASHPRPASSRSAPAKSSGPRARPRPSRADPDVLISVHRASVWLEERLVLRKITMDIRRGDCWVVHGPNGSGKSTLLRALYGDLGIARGGQVCRHGPGGGVPVVEFKRRVGYLAPELQAAHPHYLLVEEVVASGLHASVGLNDPITRTERTQARRALRKVGAAALGRRNLRAVSYGQLRRVLFARAFVHQPDILLLDEPYAGLDTRTRAALQGRVERAQRAGRTIVIAAHHRDEWPLRATHELELLGGRASYCGAMRV